MKHSPAFLAFDETKWTQSEANFSNALEKTRYYLVDSGEYQHQGEDGIARLNNALARALTKEGYFTVTFQKFPRNG